MGRADFPADFAADNYRVITHVDNTAKSTGNAFFLTSFSLGVWLAILSLVILFTFLKLLDRRFAPPDENYIPLSRSEKWFQRKKHFLLKSRLFFRLRKAIESTGAFTSEISFEKSVELEKNPNNLTSFSVCFQTLGSISNDRAFYRKD